MPPDERTTWNFFTLDAEAEAYLDDRVGSVNDDGYTVKLGSQTLLTLDVGLAGVDNLRGPDGPVTLERDQTKAQVEMSGRKIRPWKRGFDKGISQIPKDKRAALARLILAGPKPTEAEAKN